MSAWASNGKVLPTTISLAKALVPGGWRWLGTQSLPARLLSITAVPMRCPLPGAWRWMGSQTTPARTLYPFTQQFYWSN